MKRLLPVVLALSIPVTAPAAAQAPLDAETRFNNAMMHLREGRLEIAIEELKAAIKKDPKNPYFHKGLGVAYSRQADRCSTDSCRQGPLKEALNAARKALELNPYYVDARNDLGIALLRTGQRAEGKKELLAAFNDPTNPTAEITARNLGQAFLEEKDYGNASNWFQTAVSRNKAYTDGWLGLADTLVASGRLDEAVRQLEAAAKELPEDWSVVLALGEAYYRAGRFADAKPRLELAAGKDPGGASGRRAAELLKNFPN